MTADMQPSCKRKKDNMEMIEVSKVTDELVESIARLLPQLTRKPIPDKETIAEPGFQVFS